jgi:hypothetical protein
MCRSPITGQNVIPLPLHIVCKRPSHVLTMQWPILEPVAYTACFSALLVRMHNEPAVYDPLLGKYITYLLQVRYQD